VAFSIRPDVVLTICSGNIYSGGSAGKVFLFSKGFAMFRMLSLGIAIATSVLAHQDSDWHADDETFDPKLKSVVIGNNSWIGDPSPFQWVETQRTGYTHVQPTKYEGLPPAIQVSLMVPQGTTEDQPHHGTMLLLSAEQTAQMLTQLKSLIETKSEKGTEKQRLPTAMEQADWQLGKQLQANTQYVEFENKVSDQTFVYRFSIPATKKLIGAIEHALEGLKSDKQ
jgi:hypothetical protein